MPGSMAIHQPLSQILTVHFLVDLSGMPGGEGLSCCDL